MRPHPRRIQDAHGLPLERRRARLTAYVYGNILVLAAVATSTPDTIANGHAAVVVAATTGTTYLAHVLAHAVGDALGHEPTESDREELRDALPILSSGSVPIVVLMVGALTDRLDVGVAELVAMAVIIARLAGTGALVRRLGGTASNRRAAWSGFAVAGIGVVIAALKVVLLH